jgi:hypothetical protein
VRVRLRCGTGGFGCCSRAWDFDVGRARLGFLRGSGGSFRLRGGSLFGAERFHARGLETRGFCGERLLLGRELCGRLRGGGSGCGLLFSCCLNIRCLAAAANGLARYYGLRNSNGLGNGCGATTARRGCWSRLFLGTDTLLALPTRANASDLVVGEHAHMATNGNVHLPEK